MGGLVDVVVLLGLGPRTVRYGPCGRIVFWIRCHSIDLLPKLWLLHCEKISTK